MRVPGTLKSILLPKGRAFRRLPFGPAAGCVMEIDFAHQARIYFGIYERPLAPHFRRLATPGTRCFDVGADVGYDSLMLGRLTGAPVVAFECAADRVALLRANIAANPFAITVAETRVDAHEGDGLTTLDSAVESYGPPGFVKMDIEGAELDALRGATRLIETHKPAWIIEMHDTEIEVACLEILHTAGYAIEIVERQGLFRETRPSEHNRWVVATMRR